MNSGKTYELILVVNTQYDDSFANKNFVMLHNLENSITT